MSNPKYLGDGVYVTEDGGSFVLTTGHHEPQRAENVIWLDQEIIKELVEYIRENSDNSKE